MQRRFRAAAAIAAFGATLQLAATAPAIAQTGGMMHEVTHGPNAKARCSPGDPNVLVDKKSKTYVMDTAMMHAKPGSSGAKMHAKPGSSGAKTSAKTSGMVSMCKSEAEGMGMHAGSSTRGGPKR